MGFSCFGCAEPFDDVAPASENGGGDGHGQVVRSVSAIKTCGHLFHTDCLKRALEAQSGNAWVAKNCPVCKVRLTNQDILRIHANAMDARSSYHRRLEEIVKAYKNLGVEYEAMKNRFEIVRNTVGEMAEEAEHEKAEKSQLKSNMEQLGIAGARLKVDNDRFKTENERLKNMIITLSEKLTATNFSASPEFYGPPAGNRGPNNGGNICRLEYTDELQRMPMFDSSSFITQSMLNGTLPKPIPHHPPGFMYPISAMCPDNGNGSDYQGSDRTSQARSISPEIQRTLDVAGISIGNPTMNGCGMMPMSANDHHQARSTSFAFQDLQVRNYDDNAIQLQKTEEPALRKLNDSAPKDSIQTPPAQARRSYSSTAACSSAGANALPGSSFNEKMKNGEKVENNSTKGTGDNDKSGDNWHEKRSRRRTGSRTSVSGGRTLGKFDHLADKKLLYSYFHCPTCNCNWGSSQSFLNTPQTCRECRTVVYPHNQGPILSRRQLELQGKPADGPQKVIPNRRRK